MIVREILESHTVPLNMDGNAPLSSVKLHCCSRRQSIDIYATVLGTGGMSLFSGEGDKQDSEMTELERFYF